jgi:hypothetical protein
MGIALLKQVLSCAIAIQAGSERDAVSIPLGCKQVRPLVKGHRIFSPWQ